MPQKPTTAAFVTALAGTDDLRRTYATVDAMAARGDARALRELAIALELTGQNAGVERWVLEAVFDRIARSLALHPSRDNAAAAIELVEVERTHSSHWARAPHEAARLTATLLAQGQLPETCFALAPTVSSPLATETMTCWIQELVIRGVALSGVDAVTAFWSRLESAGHPLAHLPLARLAIEESLPEMLWADHKDGAALRSPEPVSGEYEKRSSLVPAFQAERLATPADLTAAAENLIEESNGRSDGGVFRLDERVVDLQSGHFARLPLDCFASADSIATARITPAAAAMHVFSAAAAGGAYNRGRGAAYGRRDMWRSLAALSGVDGTTAVKDTARAAASCRFYALALDSEWMYRVAWDLAVACLRDDARTFAVIVATDTD